MYELRNLEGKTFGLLTVLGIDALNRDGKNIKWVAKCECGNFTSVKDSNLLRRGGTKSCGCLLNRPANNKLDMAGKQYGRLKGIKYLYTDKNGKACWEFLCDCGKTVIIAGTVVRRGHAKSCGCYAIESRKARCGPLSPAWKNNATPANKHGRLCSKGIAWRKNIYKNSNYTCAKCDKTGKIVAHHIYNYADYPELRYEVSNGIGLCEQCHNNYHSIYGKKFNDEFQLAEFLINDWDKICY